MSQSPARRYPTSDAPAGGAFLIEPAELERIWTPERFDVDARFMVDNVRAFMQREVLPYIDRLEAKEPDLMRKTLHKAGELGLLGVGTPEQYDGLDLSKSTLMLLAETTASYLSFAISAGVHSGVSQLPLLYFGTPAQRKKYLPKLASGEWIGAFALSEADSGSDALSARTRAVLSPDGTHYLLSGSKMWTTNGGFADLFTVFAQVDGDKFTAFLIERETPGFTIGREERKMGLHGSSTCRLQLDQARVPVENLLGEIGQGRRPALCALNQGRLSIAATALGASKELLKTAAQYAKERKQFGKPIAEFGLIRHKLAEMSARIFAAESLIYRTAGYLDARFAAIAPDAAESGELYRAAAEEYAVECAIAKFVSTETLGYVADEALQIHGGFGYSEEFPIARVYRDARVFRIFEGANEINRLTVVDQTLKRIERGRIPRERLQLSEQDLHQFIAGIQNRTDLDLSLDRLRRVRMATLFCLDRLSPILSSRLNERQELAAALSEMIANLYQLESVWLRTKYNEENSPGDGERTVVSTILAENLTNQTEHQAKIILAETGDDEERSRLLSQLDLLFLREPIDLIPLRRRSARAVLKD